MGSAAGNRHQERDLLSVYKDLRPRHMPASDDGDSRVQPVGEGRILGAELYHEIGHGRLIREANGEPGSSDVLSQTHAETNTYIHDNTILV